MSDLIDYKIRELGRPVRYEDAVEIGFILRHLKPADQVVVGRRTYRARDPYQMTIAQLVNVQRAAAREDLDQQLEAVRLVYWRKAWEIRGGRPRRTEKKISRAEILEMRSTQYFRLWNYVKKRLEFVAQMREQAIVNHDEGNWKAAGVDKLARFGAATMIDALAGGDVLKWKEVERLPFPVALMKQSLDSTTAQVQREYARITRPKKKGK